MADFPATARPGIIACDFFVTATFRLVYVFVVIEDPSRRLTIAKPC
jgi:hypothetical protein